MGFHMRLLCAAFFLSLLGATSLWAASEQVEWPDLIDQSTQVFDDPYRDMSSDQIRDLITVVRLRDVVQKNPSNANAHAQLEATETLLQQAGFDIDWLIDQRWVVAERRTQAALAGNPDIDGQTVALAGFAIPAPPDSDGTPVAYLVPERGMCSHKPPPQPNQMIRVRLTTGWTPQSLHEPVRLTGVLVIDPTERMMQVVDGPQAMRATFRMDAQRVETLADMRADNNSAKQNQWVKDLADRLRAVHSQPNNGGITE
jgi:uncharacterized protein